MADADEDAMPRGGTTAEDADLTDETQDFRFLASLSRENAVVPKRGEKDFEPHATALQSNTLAASRQAMHNALSFQRVHQPKGYTLATYHPETNMAHTLNPKGPHFAKMGHVLPAQEDPLGSDGLRGQRLWLLPEEALYLIERGSIDIRWPADDGDEDDEISLPMSLQAAYAMFIGDDKNHAGALSLERYSVYAGLKRIGYTVHRASCWDGSQIPPGSGHFAPFPSLPRRPWYVGLLNYYCAWWSSLSAIASEDDHIEQGSGPLVRPKLYRSYADIYRRLALVNYYDPAVQIGPYHSDSNEDAPLKVTFDVWKPGSPTYKKSAPGPPDFRIAVIGARESAVPTLKQLSSLLETVPYDPPLEGALLYQNLKHGYKNVILAIVDQGVVSYLRVADAAFGREKLYEGKGRPPGGKRGGRGARGRGR